MPGPGVVDAHQHVWMLAAHDQPWLRRPGNEPLLRDYTEADLRPLAAAAGVTATVVVQTIAEPPETPDLLELAAASDLIAAVVGWVDLQSDQVADTIAALQDRQDGSFLRGIRHPVLIEPDENWLRRPAVHRGLAAVGAAGLCYDLVVPPEVLPAAVDAVAACPDTSATPPTRLTRARPGPAPSDASPSSPTRSASCPASSPSRLPSPCLSRATRSRSARSARTGSCSAPTGLPVPSPPATATSWPSPGP
jgi:FAD/FMN-containing dehydrogenase